MGPEANDLDEAFGFEDLVRNLRHPHFSPDWKSNEWVSRISSVLKEHRIGKGGVEVRGRGYAAFLQNAVLFFSGGFPGFAPWAGMRCPVRAWDRTRGWRVW